MTTFILRRLVQTIPLILGITMVTFVLVNAVPGSPVAELALNPGTRPEDVERIRRQLGLDQPFYIRYFTWLGNVLRGDFGVSLVDYRPVLPTILERLPNTLVLTVSAFCLALLVAVPVGVYSAVRRNSWFDNAGTLLTTAGVAVPTFWFGIIMILIFSVKFKDWGLPNLPATGAYTIPTGGDLLDRLSHLVMPALVLGFVQMASWTRYVRSQMLEVISQDFIRTARAKGLREQAVIFGHALRNAVLPLVTLFGLAIPNLFSGALIIETIFAYPGIGLLTFDAATQRNYTVIMGTVLFSSTLVILGNLLADVAYGVLDPRIKLS